MDTGPGTATQAAANDELVRSFLRAWEQRDTPFILDHFTDDGVYHATPLKPIVGKRALREFVAAFEGVPPGRLEIRNQVASADVVINERVDHINHDGRPIVLPICAVFEMRDGLVAAWREYFDLGAFRS